MQTILTTLKITKKPSDAPAVSKAPVRHADPARRDMTQARAVPVARVNDVHVVSKDKMDSRFRGNDEQGAARVNNFATFHQPVEFKSKL